MAGMREKAGERPLNGSVIRFKLWLVDRILPSTERINWRRR